MADSRLLIAAGQTAPSAEELPFGVRLLIEAADQVMVIAPMLPKRFEWLSSATDEAREQAAERLDSVLGQLEQLGAQPEGEVGADDPLLAFDDAIAKFDPHHLLVSLRSEDLAGWQERGLLEALHQRLRIPVTFFGLPDRLLR
jgi:hypothetical protein